MRALEKRTEVRAASSQFRASFAEGAVPIGKLSGLDVHWHDRLGLWGAFGRTSARDGGERGWNPFGQKPFDFRSNMIVEVNPPNRGIDRNLQGAFAVDVSGQRWLLHQGRMSVSGARVTEADFIAATGLTPEAVTFSDGSLGRYHKVAPIGAPPAFVQASIATFVARCAQARLAKVAGNPPSGVQSRLGKWEYGLSPEHTGDFEIAARDAAKGRRRHGQVWKALTAELARRGVPHSNDRVGLYGPDLFTYGKGRKVLFEIKSGFGAQDVFAAVGQLQVYEKLLGTAYRKVIVMPSGLGKALRPPLTELDITVVEYDRIDGQIFFDDPCLSACF